MGITSLEEMAEGRPPLRLAIAGAGRSALLSHLPALRAMPELYDVVAVCDLLKSRREMVQEAYPMARQYRLCEDMLNDRGIDVVFIALPSVEHAKAALTALGRNLRVVCEAPMALSHDSALMLRAASVKANGKLYPCLPGFFSPGFRLARKACLDPRLGEVYEATVRLQDYLRRDDWQSLKRCGGGAVWREGPDMVQQAVALLDAHPCQLWSELKRVASLGDAEDTAHIIIKGRGNVTAYVDIGGGRMDLPLPAYEVLGSRGAFSVMPGERTGKIRAVDPKFRFPRRRSSVRIPPLDDRYENLPILEWDTALPDGDSAETAFWKAVYESICRAEPFPVQVDDAVETIKYLQTVKQASDFAK